MIKKPTLIPELLCTNIAISLNFYTDVLGFIIDYQRPESGFAMLERQGAKIMIEQIVMSSERSWTAGTLEKPFGRGINLQIETSNVIQLFNTVKSSRSEIFLDIEERWYRRDDYELGNCQFIVLDPDGYMLRFFEDLGKRALVS